MGKTRRADPVTLGFYWTYETYLVALLLSGVCGRCTRETSSLTAVTHSVSQIIIYMLYV